MDSRESRLIHRIGDLLLGDIPHDWNRPQGLVQLLKGIRANLINIRSWP
jgi:hypothetical protein